MSQTLQAPETTDGATGRGRWMTVIFNNETNSIDQVIHILMRATACDQEEAEIETWEAHVYGKAPVHFAARDECERAAGIISSIGVKTEVTPEWDD
jgi:ATP-dependent Clp protease adaptor protein ClpS